MLGLLQDKPIQGGFPTQKHDNQKAISFVHSPHTQPQSIRESYIGLLTVSAGSHQMSRTNPNPSSGCFVRQPHQRARPPIQLVHGAQLLIKAVRTSGFGVPHLTHVETSDSAVCVLLHVASALDSLAAFVAKFEACSAEEGNNSRFFAAAYMVLVSDCSQR